MGWPRGSSERSDLNEKIGVFRISGELWLLIHAIVNSMLDAKPFSINYYEYIYV